MFPDWVFICIPVRSSIHQLRQTVSTEHTSLKKQEMDTMPRASYGYGGKFGLQEDRMDKVGHFNNIQKLQQRPYIYLLFFSVSCYLFTFSFTVYILNIATKKICHWSE